MLCTMVQQCFIYQDTKHNTLFLLGRLVYLLQSKILVIKILILICNVLLTVFCNDMKHMNFMTAGLLKLTKKVLKRAD